MNKFKRFESYGHFTSGYSIGIDINSFGTLLASGSSNGNAYIYNIQTSKLVNKIDALNEPIKIPCMDVKFGKFNNNSDQLLALSFWNGLIKIYSIK